MTGIVIEPESSRAAQHDVNGPKRVVVLGSTGSVGTQTLDVLGRLPGRFTVVGLAAGHWSPSFAAQLAAFQPECAAIAVGEAPASAARYLFAGGSGLEQLIIASRPDVVMLATPGLVGLQACLTALRAGAVVAIANKETLVAAGELVTRVAREAGSTIVPVDSEHSGIWQCLLGEDPRAIAEIILTSSGGAFRDTPLEEMASATPEQALRHPTWSMGAKITVDSATLMNKGLEIIEASWLFGIRPRDVSVVLHRQSIVHAVVAFADGSMKAQLSVPDMRIPIINALTYPERVGADLPRLDLAHLGALTFEPIDEARFPAIGVARRAAEAGGNHPAVLNAANDVAVHRFLKCEIRFTDIVPLVLATLDRYAEGSNEGADDVLAVDAWARQLAQEIRP